VPGCGTLSVPAPARRPSARPAPPRRLPAAPRYYTPRVGPQPETRYPARLPAGADGFDVVDARSHGDGGYRTADEVVDSALAWLEDRDPRDEIFLWVHVYDVHDARPYLQGNHETRLEVRRRSPLSGPELVGWLEAEHGLPWRFYRPYHLRRMLDSGVLPAGETGPLEQLRGAPFRRAMAALQMDLYDGQILFVDRQIRRLFTAMEAGGWMELPSTWVVTADHGEGLGEHGYYGHGRFLYQEQLHVPLVFWSSTGRPGPRRVSELVRHVDLFPTLAELAEGTLAPQVAPVQGRSLVPLLEGAASPIPPPPAYSQRRAPRDSWIPGEVLALQDGRYKYIHRSRGDDDLYDLETDPFERYDLLESSRPAGRGDVLRDELLEAFGRMAALSRGIGAGELDPAFLEELRALGYIR